MNEKNFTPETKVPQKVKEKPKIERENLNLEQELRSIYELINKMDAGGCSFMTMPIKEYIRESTDKNGFKPTRIEYLKKMVNRIYFGEYLESQKRKERKSGNDPSTRTFYQICFEGKGYYGMNWIEFERIDSKTWRTSEIGSGYTTTCSKDPEWLSEILEGLPWEKTSFKKYEETYRMSYEAKGKILGINVTVKETRRRHENGSCFYYIFEFSSEEDANQFSKFLMQKEKQLSLLEKDKLLKNLRVNNYLLFSWHQFYFIDPKYDLLSASERGGYDRGFLKMHDIEYLDLKNAVKDYIEAVVEKLYQLTEKDVEEAQKLKSPEDFESIDDYVCYLYEVRQNAINWEMIEKLLENHEEEILKRAQEYHRKEGLYDKIKIGARIKYENRTGTVSVFPSEDWMIVDFDDGSWRRIRRRSSKIEFIK